MDKLKNKVALITGSDSGIGQATAVEFARQGADVIVNYLHDADGADETKRRIEAEGRRAVVVQADHGDERQVEEMFRTGLDAFGHIDILMNNAGVDASGTYVAGLEVSELGITVNNIAPGMVLTPFNQEAKDNPEVLEEQVQSIPLKRAAEPEELARLALFLASDDAAYVSGATYVMDGGLMQMSGQGA